MAIRAVFFDAAGTLIKPARRVGESYAHVAKKFGVEVSPPQLSERFRVCFDASSPLAFPGAPAAAIDGLEQDWWKRLVRKIFVGGLATDYCVKHTVLDGLKRGFKVVLLEDAVRGVNLKPDDSEQAIEEMVRAGAEKV